MSAGAPRRFWGWGVEGAGPSDDQIAGIGRTLSERFGCAFRFEPPPRIEEIELPPPRHEPPAALAGMASTQPLDRASHTYGKAYRDVVRGYRRDFGCAPDWVACPRNEAEVAEVLDWATGRRAAVVPYGAGSSVVGGVEARGLRDGYATVVSLDLGHLDRVLEIDRASRAARIQAGVLGPALEDQLRPQGLTLRHFPQSFEFSTLGGWIATRSGGHYATLRTHIDDFVESLRVVTPSGVVESRRLPGSGAGPSPDRLFIGGEGTLGVISEAWMRLQERPRFRAQAAVRFEDASGPGSGFAQGAEVVRQLSQSGLEPSNCRLLDPNEAETAGAGDAAILIVGFESAHHPPDVAMARALECCADGGGRVPEGAGRVRERRPESGDDAAAAWRRTFLLAPYVRDALVGLGVVIETFETAVTWDRFEAFHATVTERVRAAAQEVCGAARIACRFTHIYPDGPAPYYTVIAPGRRGGELEQWDEIKQAAGDAILAAGGSITHHHAVGRDHRPWADRQRPALFGDVLRAAKQRLDPAGILNPGCLVDS